MKRTLLVGVVLALVVGACDTQSTLLPEAEGPDVAGPVLHDVTGEDPAEVLAALMDEMNAALATDGVNYRLATAEWIGNGEGDAMGGEVLAKDVGNKQLGGDFVPGDPRRTWSGTPGAGGTDGLTYAIDQTTDAEPFFGGLTGAQTTAAIQRAMATWDAVSCSDLALSQNPDFGLDIGRLAFQFGFGGSPFVFADLQHAGWRDLNFPLGVLGVTFTFYFITPDGTPTDVDGNGKGDVAFREIYYDPSYLWSDSGTGGLDVETIALHEVGHGLSQAHFGKVTLKKGGSIQASPRAVMNALYAGPLRSLQGTDNGGHCGNWSQWPNR